MSGFAAQVAAFGAKAQARIDAAIRTSVTRIGDELIALSPERTGRFKANFNYGLNAPNTSTSADTATRTLNYIDVMPAHAGGVRHYISNSLPYAAVLEFGEPGRPPHAMFGRTAAALGAIADRAAREAAQ